MVTVSYPYLEKVCENINISVPTISCTDILKNTCFSVPRVCYKYISKFRTKNNFIKIIMDLLNLTLCASTIYHIHIVHLKNTNDRNV